METNIGDTAEHKLQRRARWQAAVIGMALCAFTADVGLSKPLGLEQLRTTRSVSDSVNVAQGPLTPIEAFVIVCVVKEVCKLVMEYEVIKLCETIVVKAATPATATQPATPAVTKEVCKDVKKPVQKNVCKQEKVCEKKPKPKP
jgi:hypothetical protein